MSLASAGRPGRPRHEIEAHLRQHGDSGLSLLALFQQQHLPYPTLWRWRCRLAAIHGPASHAAPRVRRPTSPAPGQAFFSVEVAPSRAPADAARNAGPPGAQAKPPAHAPRSDSRFTLQTAVEHAVGRVPAGGASPCRDRGRPRPRSRGHPEGMPACCR